LEKAECYGFFEFLEQKLELVNISGPWEDYFDIMAVLHHFKLQMSLPNLALPISFSIPSPNPALATFTST
jgi:hypothetical protein